MKTAILTISFCLFLLSAAHGQKESRNIVYAEGLGITGYYSVNYERFQPLTRNRSVLIGAGVGFSYVERHLDERVLSLPFRLNVCVGTKNFYGEIGVNYLRYHKKDYDYRHNQWYDKYFQNRYWFFHIGARYQARKNGLFVRGFIFPVKIRADYGSYIYHIGKKIYELRNEGKKFILWGGIDVGYAF